MDEFLFDVLDPEEQWFEQPFDTDRFHILSPDTSSSDCPELVSRQGQSSDSNNLKENPVEAARKRKRIADREYRHRRKEKLVTSEKKMTFLRQQLDSLKKENESLRMAQVEKTLSLQSKQEGMKQLEEKFQQLKDDHQRQSIFVEILLKQLATIRDDLVQVQNDGTVKHQNCVSRDESNYLNKLDMKQLLEKQNAKRVKNNNKGLSFSGS